jgi:hypothetical protein
MLDFTKMIDLIPIVLKHLSYEYHILFLKYLESDEKIILNKHRSYIFCQLMLKNNLLDLKYILNLKKIVSCDTKFRHFFHEEKLNFLLIKNNNHHLIKYIYSKYPINYKNITENIIQNLYF